MAYTEYAQLFLERSKAKGDELLTEAEYYPTIDEVFNAVCNDDGTGVCDIGIVPIENTLDGYVQRTLDLLLEKQVGILDEHMVPVQFALVANSHSVEDISTLYVQFKANLPVQKIYKFIKSYKYCIYGK